MEIIVPIYIFGNSKKKKKTSFVNHKSVLVAFSMFCLLSMSLHMCTCSHIIGKKIPNHKNVLIVFSTSCSLSMSLHMCHSYITSCYSYWYNIFCTIKVKCLKQIWFHCDETLNVTILAYVTMLIIHMTWIFFFHHDENLNVTVLMNVTTWISHVTWNFNFLN